MNKEWHLKNPMPKNPTLEQRAEWHIAHLKNCDCRSGIPQKLREEMVKHHIAVPDL